MKKVLKIISAAMVLLLIIYIFYQDFQKQSPVIYFKMIWRHIEKTMAMNRKLGKSVNKKEDRALYRAYEEFRTHNKKTIDSLTRMEDFKGNTQLRDKAVELIREYGNFNKNNIELYNLVNNPDYTLTQDDFDEYAKRSAKIRETMARLYDEFVEALDKFKAQHKF